VEEEGEVPREGGVEGGGGGGGEEEIDGSFPSFGQSVCALGKTTSGVEGGRGGGREGGREGGVFEAGAGEHEFDYCGGGAAVEGCLKEGGKEGGLVELVLLAAAPAVATTAAAAGSGGSVLRFGCG